MSPSLLRLRIGKLGAALRSKQLARALLSERVLAAIEHKNVLTGPFATVFDIGANRGQFSLAARHYLPDARILAFEPLPTPARTFRHLFRNDALVALTECAIGPDHRQARIHISRRDDSSSLLAPSSLQERFFPGTHAVGYVTVNVSPLSAVVERSVVVKPALLKLDVQGYEYEALLGCELLLQEFDCIYCECSLVPLYEGQTLAPQIISWLSDRNFVLRSVHNATNDRDTGLVQADFLFTKT